MRFSFRFGSALEADGAPAITELQRRRVTHRNASNVRSQHVHANQHRERNLRDDEQRVCKFESCNKQRHHDVPSNFRTRAADSDDVGGRVLERDYPGTSRQTVVKRGTKHRICRGSVDERIANQHSVDHCIREQLRDASPSR